MSKIHILGIAGTFMGGVAALARELGDEVEGSDQAIYPPMSTQLEHLGIALKQGYLPEHIGADCAQVIVGNALSRGNAAVEAVLDSGRAYTSGAQWLSERVLPGRDTLAVAGTHGKTTTTSILTWLLQAAGREPGFLIGGVAEDFGVSARLGGTASSAGGAHRDPVAEAVVARQHAAVATGPRTLVSETAAAAAQERPLFVVEADEYDTAFFDKRSKFVHYRPLVAILNNLEYDHADIFPDVAAIQRQFHHLVRTVPRRGRLIVNGEDAHLREVLAMGCWTPVERFGFDPAFEWSARPLAADGSHFAVLHRGQELGEVRWPLLGRHNVMNALAALAAAHAVGVAPAQVMPALAQFRSVKRRLEVLGQAQGITVYDDFAHHPTAIRTTLEGLRANVGAARIVVAMEPRSNSMRLGAHAEALAPALEAADAVVFLQRPELAWDAGKVIAAVRGQACAAADVDALLAALQAQARAGDHVVFMSNGGFDGAPRRFLAALQ
ncbi:UDP-N-acetylmuramate:L-alanyl-gamma-D-glutamyl-meso-diaminopimelate ligase [Xanthomonas sp. CFBP 8703]|jgi:UDP-N-acetylmuramate: L-alanyl-gamma-D-glutamyl-meso-diaminopimelate ligase|uniref:UDP-N-acetylmuramate--L-alanyl-gamma-D-glutamyl-meso-2,6-diaminoheptandioate ligase n=1 Tax=Xanthomonas bonasiae TaxID=2810351 RepID=A0ABS3B1W4_9XANT|nr:UDP-N-acetylmuramate:L-alanyl-gamma-D-glutamyl-meso-diaminopimelate ligase [Xanthomonas bonasiae]MBN6102516.1 UDP-N-acetylmuramate:L-alanyl-gamma-D-glutamyl-meso-diaminopimelate ligase [Xanthomonas bonasiae]MBN6113274.1 UDP-N-acetylmuramate:L-alanyl-gamma-D-glutamyl-meso-diaminopimelate ligase [Xanthomonas bonasiae]